MAVCALYSDGTFGVLHYYNSGKSSSLMLPSNPSVGFTNIVTSYANNVLTCSFTRAKTFSGVSKFFDLNNQYYLLIAIGKLSGTGFLTLFYSLNFSYRVKFLNKLLAINEHSIQGYSSNMINFVNTVVTTPENLIKSTVTTVAADTNTYIDGGITIKWSDNGDSTNFTITCTGMYQNSYCAFGLSVDQSMVRMYK